FVVIIIAVIMLARLYSRTITRPLLRLKHDVQLISKGNLDRRAEITTNDEIGDLATSFNNMAVSLDQYIKDLTSVTAEKERIGAELDVAKHIQSSMLPCIFPPYPDRKEFEIYATMQPAKEVGGDFYDFFMVDDAHLAVVMADVSGKGVPAALFMVIGKTLIKDHTEPGSDLGSVFSEVNNMLCESNSEGLFITAFEGVLDLKTGEFRFVNAGHEPPFIAHVGQPFDLHKIRPGFVLAGMEDVRYKSGSIQLDVGDKIFLYTDGVTEATDAANNLYGMERLTAALNTVADRCPDDILPAIKKDIDEFVGSAPQFDDITMLCLEYKERMP
ncbi:MAG: SpoIIE family protein phosphatase, partial [Victivallales bacterium]|nr:SpoIIE family protein phosphatase [Victivallales bacterium]